MNNGYTKLDGKFYKEHDVVMLPAEEAENCFITKQGVGSLTLEYHRGYFTKAYLQYIYAKAYHLYFLSHEEIKEGDWCILRSRELAKCTKVGVGGFRYFDDASQCYGGNDMYLAKKIIATTDSELHPNMVTDTLFGITSTWQQEAGLPRPSNSFIEKFVTEWNKGNKIEKVLVEFQLVTKFVGLEYYDSMNPQYELKIASYNTIAIKPLVVKNSWSGEEVVKIAFEAFYKGYRDCEALKYCPSDIKFEFDKWIKQNL